MKHLLKKAVIWFLAATLIFSMTACSSGTVTTTAPDQESRETLPNRPAGTTEAESSNAGTTETSAEQTTEAVTEPAVETTEEPSAEAPAGDPQERLELAYIKYQHLLAEHMDKIENDMFQIIDPNGDADRPMQVALADIHGDEVPEIIFVEKTTGENGVDVQSLEIFTFYGDTIDELYEAEVDIAAGGGMRFCLFQNGEDKEPWLMIEGGEGETRRQSLHRIRYERGEDGTYVWTGTRFYCVELGEGADPSASEEEGWFFCDEKQTESLTKEAYYDRMSPLLNDTHPLIHNYREYYLPEDLTGKPMQAMTYDEAMAEMEKVLYPEKETPEPGGMTSEPFTTIQGEYFQHGGDWTTWLTVCGDGSFSGEYTAHYFQDEKRHYDVGEFHGSFADAKQIDELTWTIRVESVTVDGEIGEEWEEDGESYTRIADPVALIPGSVLTVYLPGSDSAQIPEEFFMWIRSDAEQMPRLEGTALINDEEGVGSYYYMLPED